MGVSRILGGKVPGTRVTHLTDTLVLLSVPIAEALESPEASVLTRSEHTVASLATRGFSDTEIARRRRCSPRTVANQLAAVYQKLGIKGRRELKAKFGT
ncbi:MAG TPA: helix-turn-helix transcriptional regulator [Polyangiaceae bacterium]